MKDPNFKPKKPGQDKRSAAFALCTWLDQQGKLKATSDGVKISMEKAEILFTGPFRVVLPIIGAKRTLVEKAEGGEEVRLWLHVEASGPERDLDGDRFSEAGLAKMVEYANKSDALPFLDGHYRDLLSANLGTVYNPYLTEEKHFAFDVLLNSETNQFSVQLFNDVLAGKRHGASIAGIVHEAEIEEFGEGEFGRVFSHVELLEISRTSWPSYRSSFITLLANKVGKLPQDEYEEIVQRRNEVIELTRKSVAPESEDKQQEILDLVKGLVKTTEAVIKSSDEDKEESGMPENKKSSDEDGTEVIMEKDQDTPAAVEETPVEEVVEETPKEEPAVEQEAETVTETVTETPPEQEVKTSEVVGETQKRMDGSLAENVDTRMMRRRFGVLTYTMQEMVESAVRRGKGDEAFSVIDDFSREGKDVISKLIDAQTPVVAGAFLEPFEEAIEMATGRLTKSRVDRIIATRESAIKEDLGLIEMLKNIDAIDDSKVVEATEKAEKAEKAVSELARMTDERERRDEEKSKARSEELRKIAESLAAEPEREEIARETDEEPIEISEENRLEAVKSQWLSGIGRK